MKTTRTIKQLRTTICLQAIILALSLFTASSLSAVTPREDSVTHPDDTITTVRTKSHIKIDGHLSEKEWNKAIPVNNFYQREPAEGDRATEETEVYTLYDKHNIYFGVKCFDREAHRISAKEMVRDFDWGNDDDFEIMISPFNDNRNGYLFITNPNGAMADVWFGSEGGHNTDWNGIWEVAVTKDSLGWYAEFRIPFSTLKFRKGEKHIWAVNFQRNIRRKNEQVTWKGWSRQYSLDDITHSGSLTGLSGIKQKERLAILPYLVAGTEISGGQTSGTLKAGGELNYDITPTMKINLTVNTDFAQVESDRQEVNLSRFSIYYPEKRQFFLEGNNYFEMGVSSADIFYSRRIGIEEGSMVPILGGGRIFGKLHKTSIGAMILQTGAMHGSSSANSSVFRIRQDIFEESTVGFITTQKFSKDKYNSVYGTDFTYSTSRLFGDKKLMTGFSGAISTDRIQGESTDNQRSATYHIFFFYPNDIWSFRAGMNSIQENFKPALGFVNRSNYKRVYSRLNYRPRFKKMPSFIRNLSFELYDIDYYINDKTGLTETISLDVRPLGINFHSGDYIGVDIEYQQDNPYENYTIVDSITIPAGRYEDITYQAEFHSFDGRTINGGVYLSSGSFYTGQRTGLSMYMNLSVNKHLNMGLDWTHNNLRMPEGDFRIDELGGRVSYAFNPLLNTSLFAQWNNDQEEALLNYRVNWIPKPGSYLYLVMNQSIDTSDNKFRITRTTIMAKLIWRFAI
jgi:hypothetical protein